MASVLTGFLAYQSKTASDEKLRQSVHDFALLFKAEMPALASCLAESAFTSATFVE